MKHEPRAHLALAVVSLALLGSGCIAVDVKPRDTAATKAAPSENGTFRITEANVLGHRYTIFEPKALAVRFALERPSDQDLGISLVVPGTYTSPTGAPEGFIVSRGTIVQKRERQAWNATVDVHADGTVSIEESDNGKKLNDAYLAAAVVKKDSLFQAHLLVKDGKSQPLKPQAGYQRRALAVMPDGSARVIESRDFLDLQEFADALVALGVRDAANIDMGSYSEGWYRDPESGEVRRIGYATSDTAAQSNWIVFSK